jgi:hypothetical protein
MVMMANALACIIAITLESRRRQQCSRHNPEAFLHAALTPAGVAWRPETSRGISVDFIFILALVALYAATCALTVGVARLAGLK